MLQSPPPSPENSADFDGEGALDRYANAAAARVRPRVASNWMLWSIAAFFLVFILWAAFAQVDRSVRALGRVVPSAQLQTVSNLEGGILSEILVSPGQTVSAGDVLVRLDPTVSGSDYGSSRIAIASLEARVARLAAEAQGTAPDWSRASFGPADIISTERMLYGTRLAELSSISSQGRARIAQAQQAVVQASAQLAARQSAANAAASELRMIQPLVARGLEPQMSLVRSQSAAASAASDAAAARAAIASAQASVAEAQANIRQLQQDWRARAGSELSNARAELATRREAVPALADRVSRTAVVAPMAGKVNRILLNTIGGSVTPGAPIVEIVPSRDALIVEAQVDPKDISAIRIAQPSRVTLTAFDSSIYGSFEGSVISISPDATVDERTGQSHYSVRIKTKANGVKDQNGKALPIAPGMVADVRLLGEKRSILSYIMSPLSKVTTEAMRE